MPVAYMKQQTSMGPSSTRRNELREETPAIANLEGEREQKYATKPSSSKRLIQNDNIWYTNGSLPIAKRVGFFLGGSPALELASSSFYFIEKK